MCVLVFLGGRFSACRLSSALSLLAADAEGATGPQPTGGPDRDRRVPQETQLAHKGTNKGPDDRRGPAGAPTGPQPHGPPGPAADLYANLVWVIYDLKPDVT